jgi:OOP family OmpA-OmpF porin
MNSKALIAVLGVAVAAFALPASAQMRAPALSSAYVGGSIGQAKFRIDCAAGVTCDTSDTAWRLFAGYQFHPNVAVELGYANLGDVKFSGGGESAKVESSAWDFSALLSMPLYQQFSLLGRLGMFHSKLETSASAGSGIETGDKTDTGFTYGLGFGFDFSRNLGLRAEWQRYSKVAAQGGQDTDIDNYNVGVLWRFQ